jgi:GntR family transcriptional regulator
MKRTEGAAATAVLNRELIDADSPSPLYFQVYTVLYDAIVKGLIPAGSRMPSEKEISDGFEVSRITARRTLVELAAKGLVVRHRGKGTFVSQGERLAPIVAPLGSNAESLGDLGRGTTLTVLQKRMAVLPPELQDAFGLVAGTASASWCGCAAHGTSLSRTTCRGRRSSRPQCRRASSRGPAA